MRMLQEAHQSESSGKLLLEILIIIENAYLAINGVCVHRSEPKRLATTLETENEESCTTYNMLKVFANNIEKRF